MPNLASSTCRFLKFRAGELSKSPANVNHAQYELFVVLQFGAGRAQKILPTKSTMSRPYGQRRCWMKVPNESMCLRMFGNLLYSIPLCSFMICHNSAQWSRFDMMLNQDLPCKSCTAFLTYQDPQASRYCSGPEVVAGFALGLSKVVIGFY